MAYNSIKDGIAKMLKAKGFTESPDIFTFEEGSDQSTDKKFRIERPNVSTDGEGVEFLQTLVRPVFTYKVVLGFKLSEQSEIIDYDVAQILLDTIIAYFNNPANYTSFCIKMKTRSIDSQLVDDHLETEVILEVLDDITLT